MRQKPDTSQFKLHKDHNAFLDGGDADKKEKESMTITTNLTTVPTNFTKEDVQKRGRGRVQKIFNFPEYLADMLREEAITRSREIGSRVTEKDIVVNALEEYLNKK